MNDRTMQFGSNEMVWSFLCNREK